MVVCDCCLCRTGYKVQGHNGPLPVKDLGNAPTHSPLLRRIKVLLLFTVLVPSASISCSTYGLPYRIKGKEKRKSCHCMQEIAI